MKLLITITPLALLASSAFAAVFPACSSNSTTPCSCPNGTSYSQSATFAVIGAAATDFKDVTADFFNSAWSGVQPFATSGPDNQDGSTRTSHLLTLVGNYVITEQLTNLGIEPDGTFIQQYEQLPSTVPLDYHSGKGSFSGYWVSLEVQYTFENETAVIWSAYACFTGHPFNFARFHENAILNATKILEGQGKLLGQTIPSRSTQSF